LTPAVDTPAPFTAEPAPSATEDPGCPDPYPQGAPYAPEAGKPLRILPAGSPGPLAPYRALPLRPDPALQRIIEQSLGAERRHFAVIIKDLGTGRGIAIAPDRQFYAASLFKTWVMLEAFHQREAGVVSFDEEYIVSNHYAREFRLNPGELEPCSAVAVGNAVAAMIRISDNVAANMVLDRLGSSNVNAALEGLGAPVSGFSADLSLPTTASEMALLMEAIGRGQAVNARSSLEMTGLLLAQTVNDRIPALLPPGTDVAHKTGNWENATHDAAIVFSPASTYVIVVLTDYDYHENGAERIARLSRAVYDHFNRAEPPPS
jgi:beta-lactamase class A